MNIIKTAIEGVVILEPKVYGDTRGYFFESFSQQQFDTFVQPTCFVQDNESYSKYGVLRGLHYQTGDAAQAKLVRVVKGEILDIAVDIRSGSPTFGKHVAIRLSEENKQQLFIPRGFAHGFVVLSPFALFQYKCDNYYDPQNEGGLRFNDPQLGIDWLIPADDIILSDKDKLNPFLDKAELFTY